MKDREIKGARKRSEGIGIHSPSVLLAITKVMVMSEKPPDEETRQRVSRTETESEREAISRSGWRRSRRRDRLRVTL